jgi:ribosomal-protein-alanine N-acetyltransferase
MPKLHTCGKSPIRIRKAQVSDIEAVGFIERQQFTVPWSEEYFSAELINPLSSFWVAVEATGGKVIGFMVFWVIDETIELHQVAVSSGEKRRGIASELLRFLLRTAREQDIDSVYLEVRQSNTAAIGLYEKFGFRKTGQRKEYYRNPTEDACLFSLRLPPRAAE